VIHLNFQTEILLDPIYTKAKTFNKMSVFGKLFGGKKGYKPQTTGEAIQNLRETEEMLMKKQDFLEKKIESEMVVARKVRLKFMVIY
jgi:hypothetical protein